MPAIGFSVARGDTRDLAEARSGHDACCGSPGCRSRCRALLLAAVQPGTKVSAWVELSALTDAASLIRALRDVPAGGMGQLPALSERMEFLFSLTTRRGGITPGSAAISARWSAMASVY